MENSRTIKFRAWDKVYKRMVKSSSYDFICFDGSLGTATQHEIGGSPMMTSVSDLIVMQYTGLKDMDGIEIYEGDIVKLNYYDSKFIEEVKFLHTSEFYFPFYPFTACYSSDGRNYAHFIKNKEMGVEVIGNIYENPELLKQ